MNTGLKTQQLKQEMRAFELKWGLTFEAFSQRCERGTLGKDPYAYDVESDFWDWESAVTLLTAADPPSGSPLPDARIPTSEITCSGNVSGRPQAQ